jgi:signal transduction histidine kinase
MKSGHLNNKDANPELLENIEYIYKSGEILIDLLNDILDLSKVEAGKMEVHLEHVNIVELIENIHTLSKGNLTQKGLYIKFDLNGIKEILTDKKKLNQILFNLIGNAVKFTDKGGIELNLTQNDKEYCFSVKDSGVGIGFSECKEIFDAYKSSRYQGFTKKISGSGLGLTISRKLIELLNGKIWVESKINEGSTFYFTLPKNNEAKKLKKMA